MTTSHTLNVGWPGAARWLLLKLLGTRVQAGLRSATLTTAMILMAMIVMVTPAAAQDSVAAGAVVPAQADQPRESGPLPVGNPESVVKDQEAVTDPGGQGLQERVLETGERVWEAAWESVRGQRIVLGAAYEQGTLKFFGFHGDHSETVTLTDNGRIAALFHYETEEQYFARYPLQTGQAAFGYNLSGTYASILVDRQLLHSAFVGDDVGTRVEGEYLVLTPSVFVRLGPLYPERTVFWKFAVGAGLGLVRFDGMVQPHAREPTGPPQSVATDGVELSPVMTFNWVLQVERWLVVFRSLYLQGHAGDDRYTYELYSLGLAYTFQF